ncbi:MAG: hypothetical protein HY586_07690 [Candidatus Omnitrophica bacterium]|nr:hypothetical protein [Candidatus Omnitrophota bacterium]
MLYLRKRKIALKKGMMLAGFFAVAVAALEIKDVITFFLPLKFLTSRIFDIALVILTCLISYKPLEQLIHYLFREWLFKKGVGYQVQLFHSAGHLISCLDLREFSNLVVNTFCDLLHVKYVAFLILDSARKEFVPGTLTGFHFREIRNIQLGVNSPLIEYVRGMERPILRYDALKVLSWTDASKLSTDFELLRAQAVIPVYGDHPKRELLGIITLSSKPTHLAYLPHELKLFHDFSNKIGQALENAIRYNEIKFHYEELKDFQSRLVQVNKFSAIEQLATGIAHEIHNPLTIISGKAQMLLLNKDKNLLTSKAEEDLKLIVQQTSRAAEITRKLLMFSKPSPERKETLSFKNIIDDTFSLISYQTSIEHIEIIKELDPKIPEFKGYVEEFREIFLNLFLNAIQSVDKFGTVRVLVQYMEGTQCLNIQVEDSGCGIKEEHLANVFDPFFTTKQNSLGLGLFVTQRIIQRNGGSIHIESEPTQGTRVSFTLPMLLGSELPTGEGVLLGEEAKEKVTLGGEMASSRRPGKEV